MKVNIRLIYLYLFSAVGLIVAIVGAVRMVDLGLKVFVFGGADRYEYVSPKMLGEIVDEAEQKRIADRESVRQRQRELSGSLAMIVVGVPVYLYHWKTIQKENRS